MTPAEENAAISAAEKEAQALTINSTSMIEEAITLHRMLVVDDRKLYDTDYEPIADKAARDAAWIKEVKAFRILARMPCATPAEAQMKLAYFLEEARPGEWSNFERLTWEAYIDEEHKGNGDGDEYRRLLETLYSKPRPVILALDDLLERHRRAAAAHVARMEITDASEGGKRDEAWAQQVAACDAENEAIAAILNYRPLTVEEFDLKALFVLDQVKGGGFGVTEMIALLSSVRPVDKSNNGEKS